MDVRSASHEPGGCACLSWRVGGSYRRTLKLWAAQLRQRARVHFLSAPKPIMHRTGIMHQPKSIMHRRACTHARCTHTHTPCTCTHAPTTHTHQPRTRTPTHHAHRTHTHAYCTRTHARMRAHTNEDVPRNRLPVLLTAQVPCLSPLAFQLSSAAVIGTVEL